MKLAARSIVLVAAPAALSLVAPAAGQKPVRTRRDSLYTLAVDSARYPGVSHVFLLDEGLVTVERTGVVRRTYRQVIQILKPEAVEPFAEQAFSFDPDRERLVINWMRVVTPGGEILADEPEVSQDADVPAAMSNPVYQNRKVRRATLPKVAPGTIVDWSYTTEDVKPYLPGSFATGWRVTMNKPVRRSHFRLDTPVGYQPRIKIENLPDPPTVTAGGRVIRTWAFQDVPAIEFEPFAADSNGVVKTIDVAGPITWTAIGGWYAALAKDRYQATPVLEAKVRALVAGARSLEDSLKAVHRFVARDIRYVAISLGMGGYQPRSAGQALDSGLGDCKDKTTLFVAMVGLLGVRAYPVLISSDGKVERTMPSLSQFDHVIAAVERPGGSPERLFVDLTAADEPWGSVPINLKGQFGLLVEPDGRTTEVTVPEDDPTTEVGRVSLAGVIDTAGYFTGRLEMEAGGPMATMLRIGLSRPLDDKARQQFATGIAGTVFPDAQGDSLDIVDTGAGSGRPHVRVRIIGGRAAQLAGNAAIVTVPLAGQGADFAPLIRELEKKPRTFPIDAEAVGGKARNEATVRLALPEGWRAQLPAAVDLASPFGTLRRTFEQVGRELVITTTQSGGKGIIPPERVGELTGWFKKLQDVSRLASTVVVIRG